MEKKRIVLIVTDISSPEVDELLNVLEYQRHQVEILTPADPKVQELAKTMKKEMESAMGICHN